MTLLDNWKQRLLRLKTKSLRSIWQNLLQKAQIFMMITLEWAPCTRTWVPGCQCWSHGSSLNTSLSLLIFHSNGNNIIINSLADAWLHFVNFLEKVFQLFLGHCLPWKSFFRGQYISAYRWEWRLTDQENTILKNKNKNSNAYSLWVRRSGKYN